MSHKMTIEHATVNTYTWHMYIQCSAVAIYRYRCYTHAQLPHSARAVCLYTVTCKCCALCIVSILYTCKMQTHRHITCMQTLACAQCTCLSCRGIWVRHTDEEERAISCFIQVAQQSQGHSRIVLIAGTLKKCIPYESTYYSQVVSTCM